MTGRGRGESEHVGKLDSGDPNLPPQMETARQLGIPEGQVPVRGRGSFHRPELRTIPANAPSVSSQGRGEYRVRVDILANFVEMSPLPNRLIYKYRVDFEPQVESSSTLRFLFKTASALIFQSRPIYDGFFECRSGQKLSEEKTSITIQDEREPEKPSYKVTITMTGAVDFGPESLRLYNMLMKDFLRDLDYFQPQRGVFVHESLSKPIGERGELMMMHGYRTSANMHDGGRMLMNLEATHKLMQRKNVLEFMADIRKRSEGLDLEKALEAQLVGKLVVTVYDKRAYRIEGVRTKMNPTHPFEKGGKPITFIDYYKKTKNVTINSQSQPLLLVVPNSRRGNESNQRETYLVPELCNIAGLTESQRNDNRLKMDLIKASQVRPTERVVQLRKFLTDFHSKAEIQSKLSDWGYAYAKDGLRFKASVLPSTKIAFGRLCQQDRSTWSKSSDQTGDISVRGVAVMKSISKIVVLFPQQETDKLQRIIEMLKKGFDGIGIIPGTVVRVCFGSDNASDYVNAIKRLPPDTTCAIVIMSHKNKERYDAIKKAASGERGLITQVITSSLILDPRKGAGAATKIAIQVAAKVGGEPWWADFPASLKNVMICGYDTYHDTAQRGRSFGAFLASMNEHFSRWWSKADLHDKLEELSSQVSANMVEAVRQYSKNNGGNYPERIIIYRDGVGDGQIEHVFNVELKLIKQALNDLQAPKKIMLTMIIVNKRIGARFYMGSQSDVEFANPPPGTVIDHTVTRTERYDFYLISQSTRHGSITPTYYNIIHDDSGFPPEVHQKMAFKMCMLYYNWQGTVRVPAPCQYAHKLALLCGEHLHQQPNSVLDDRLHFL